MAMEAAICTLNPGMTMKDFDDALSTFKTWANKNDYKTFMAQNMPLYIGGDSAIPILLLEFGSFEKLGEGWDKVARNGQQMLAAIDRAADCRRNLSHYYPLHSSEEIQKDDERVMVTNWCTRHEGITWDEINAVHGDFDFSENVGHAGLIFPALGIRDGDWPGEFAHLRVFASATAMLAEQNLIANKEGWRDREAYFDNYADCAGPNAYFQNVITRP